ncbi:MAG: hypothetical protein JWP50_1355 [Phenylobacterium sp.]|nr:hypothetical protein [Phenylobacterium sp.]
MFLRAPEAHSRSFLKAVSWRILGSIDTFVISYFVTGRLVFAASIASVETFTKIILFYFHERAWALSPFGRADKVVAAAEPAPEAKPAPASTSEAAVAH